MAKLLNKKIFIISLIILPLFVLAGMFFYFLNQKQAKIIPPAPKAEESEQEKIISRQLKELDELRQRAVGRPLSQEQIQKQLEELDKLRSAQ